MHPLNNRNFGTTGIQISFYNGTSVVNGYITKQTGTDTFEVTDGTHTATCSLAPTVALAGALAANPTYCTILAYPPASASGATFTPAYGVSAATIAAGGAGSTAGYAANDVLTLTGSGGGHITVNTVDGGGGIETFTVSAAGSVTALLTNPVATTGGTGTGATFALTYKLLSVTSSGGTGYVVGDQLEFNGMTATVMPVADISTATSGAATAVTVTTAGSGIRVAATSVGVSGAAQNVIAIYSRRIVTIDSGGNLYENFWTLGTPVNGSAYIPTY